MRRWLRKTLLVVAALVSLVLAVWVGLWYYTPKRGGQMDKFLYEMSTLSRPACEGDYDCADVPCPPEGVPRCSPYDDTRKGFPRFCGCSRFRFMPNPDGGPGEIFVKCVRNPDGGTPICGEWDDKRFVILAPDGGIIVDRDGGVL